MKTIHKNFKNMNKKHIHKLKRAKKVKTLKYLSKKISIEKLNTIFPKK